MDRLLSIVATAFAAIVLVALPGGYFAFSYNSQMVEIRTELQNQSRRLTYRVEADPSIWTAGHPKLADLMKLRPWDGDAETRTLVDKNGALLSESRDQVAAPIVTRSIPVFRHGQKVGTLTLTRSQLALWHRSAIVLMVAALLAAALYFAIRIVPARRLRQTVALLVEEREQNSQLQGALDMAWLNEEEQRIHADEMRRQKAILSSLIDAMPDLISYKDLDGVYMGCNLAFANAVQMTRETIVGKTDAAFFDQELAQVVRARDLEMLRSHEPLHIEEWIVLNGQRKLMQVTKAPFRDCEGNLIGLIGVARDVTQQRQAEADIRGAKELAEDATRMKSDFLANMSHEIRTPMNAVLGLSHLLAKTQLDARQRDYVQKVASSGQHLMRIINDILDFSKVEAGKLEVEMREFELEEVVSTLSDMVADKCAAKGLELVLNIAPEVPRHLVGDSLRLGQVLVNLAGNAVKFTERGEIVISVMLESRGESGAMLMFRVDDTGIGMSEETVGRLFGSFHQADTSTTRKYGGTGLGLAISMNLVRLMGGEIGVDSQQGYGSSFWCRLPFGVVQAAPAAPRTADLHGRRALVVDDNDVARTVIVGMLQAIGLDVVAASSGAGALALIEQAAAAGHAFDVVYVDWQMPGMDGVETARRVRRLQLSQPPLLVMVTAFNKEDVLREGQDVGLLDVLTKPVSASALHQATLEALASGGTPPTAHEVRISSTMAALSELRGARVLLVEDNDINQIVAAEILADAGLVVDIADDGLQGLHRVQHEPFDIVLMDMHMPVMDGLEATREIRKVAHLRGLPIVAMTANAMDHDRKKCLDAGMNDFVSKPIDPEELWRVLLRWTSVRAPIAG